MTLYDLTKSGKTFWRFSQSERGKSQENPYAEYLPGHITVADNGGKLSFVSNETIGVCFMYGDILTELNFNVMDENFQKIMDCEVNYIGNSLGEYQSEKLLTKANYSLEDLSTIRLLFSMVTDTSQLISLFCYKNYDGDGFVEFLLWFGFKESALLVSYLKNKFKENIYISPKEILELIDEYLRDKGSKKIMNDVIKHYDLLVDEGNDPVHDPDPLREYMDKWDGQVFIDKMHLDENKTVLEIGVGTGRLAVRVAPLCGEFYGVDISSKTIERAKENLADFKNVRLTCADFLSYEFGRTFDVVYSSLTFMHIEDKQRAVNKIAGLLNDAGRFVLSIDKNPSEFIDTGTRKIRIFPDTTVEMAECIRTAGLTILNQYDTEFATIFVAQKG